MFELWGIRIKGTRINEVWLYTTKDGRQSYRPFFMYCIFIPKLIRMGRSGDKDELPFY